MADPRNELADIIVPVAPAVVSDASGLPLWAMAAGLAAVVCLVLAIWWWHRRRFSRRLQTIARAVAQQQGTPADLAGFLDAWGRSRFQLPRLDAAICPQGIGAVAWTDWVNALLALRFAPSPPSGWDDLAALCETARQWNRHV